MASLPVPGGKIASRFGINRGGVWHWGDDVAGPAGATVVAPEAMTVVTVSTSADPERADNTTLPAPFGGYGPGIVLAKGASGAFHLLAHLATVEVAEGAELGEGDHVGTLATHVGKSGPHTHWEMRIKPIDSPATRASNTFDPERWLASGRLEVNTAPQTWLAWGLLLWFVLR